ncbi:MULTISPECIES: hypothetical protein [unclassified Mycobacterium]|uniref:hypothetical protein n=1 Tax=unclassified Mycobacterium TaxID=2642494 RepID=UPI00080206B0|nr:MULTISPECIES: hypothetical protein [unclassified Mycobacterium]OBG60313.1 hypothetical protein A5703_02130 [Mycobacterium sp. E188]OBG81794.1 hypothetical protein A5701_09595 [Mycobacterium sp. E3305]OBH33143.1 hypothetical protein A5691_10780 [Mycobacterium sp. E183]
MVNLDVEPNRRAHHRRYAACAAAIAAWALVVLWFAIKVVPLDVYWMSYYAADYTHGFVRRGLAGELVRLLPGHYFAVALGLRWLSTAVYLCGLAAVAGVVLLGRGRSERGLMVVLLIPLLPFGVPFAAYSARPDLFGGAALALFSSALVLVRSRNIAMACCAAYGAAIAALTLVHEAIGLQFALGAVLAIVALGGALENGRGPGALLAVTPGVCTTAAVAAFGRHDIAAQLCASVPRHVMPNPFATVTSPASLLHYVVDGQSVRTDYHDWVCRNVMPNYDNGIGDAVRAVGHIGMLGLTVSLIFGAGALALTMWGLSAISGVSLGTFVEALRGRMTWVAGGLLLICPVFVTGYDWTRWLTIVTFDVGVVFILLAAGRPEIEREPTPKALRSFILLAVILALIPVGAVPGFGGPRML